MNRALVIWFPDWPIQRLIAARPELKRRQVAIYELHSRGGLRIVAGGEACGIRPGMPLAGATALACQESSSGTSVEVHFEPCDPAADRAALVELAEWCERFSPAVGIEPGERPDGLALDASGLGSLFGGEESLAGRVVRELQGRGLAARVAIADTLGAAWAVAHYGVAEAPRIVPPGQTVAALAPLPVESLRLPAEMVELLATVGIRTVGQVTALPRGSLVARFGPRLLERLDQATGAAAELLVPHRAAPEFAVDWTFENPTDHQATIERALEELIERLARLLAARDAGALGLTCRIACLEREPVHLSLGLFRPSASPKHLWELLRLRLETVRLESPVAALWVGATSTAPLEQQQQELFVPDRSRAAGRHLAVLVDRLSSRLGRSAVVRPRLLPDAQPEYACVDFGFSILDFGLRASGTRHTNPNRERGGESARTPTPSLALRASRDVKQRVDRKSKIQNPKCAGPRPLWLHRRPIALEVVSLVPDGPPVRFRFGGTDERIARSWGPERIETGWWRAATCVRRDYYRVETTAGSRFWLFRRLSDGQWFLHGEFG